MEAEIIRNPGADVGPLFGEIRGLREHTNEGLRSHNPQSKY
jgi:hypothetical protein